MHVKLIKATEMIRLALTECKKQGMTERYFVYAVPKTV